MADLEIIFLGTGTSQGVPVIGCDCTTCKSSDPRDNRLRSAIFVRTPECSFSIDTPPEFRIQCLRENIGHIDAVVYTHSHTDHILGFDDLRRFCEMSGEKMPIYAAPDTMADLRRVFQYAFETEVIWRNYIRPDPHVIDGAFSLGETRLVPLRLPHGKMILNGYLMMRNNEKLVAYMTDCHSVPDEVVSQVAGVKVLVIDALRHKEHPTHLSVQQAVDISKLIKPESTYFIHMCHDLLHEKTQASLPPGVFLSYDGLRITV
ncbi:MAG: MBL fold metallo-hydrolase [Chthoniobacterales bacterium]